MKKLCIILVFLLAVGDLIAQQDAYSNVTREVTKHLAEGNVSALTQLLVSKDVALNYYKALFSESFPPESKKALLKSIEDSYDPNTATSNEKKLQEVIQKIAENKIVLEDLKYVPNDYPDNSLVNRPIQVEIHLSHEAYKRIYFKVINVEDKWYLFDALINVTH